MTESNTITNCDSLNWAGCYDDSWRDMITPESFCHPAKMARGLLARILRHAKEEGWLWPGAVCVDPFGGVCTTGILGAYENVQVVAVELEERFVKLAEQNFALHAAKWQILGCPRPVMIQGDSRRLCELVAGADCVVSSPPFQGAHAGAIDEKSMKGPSSWVNKVIDAGGYGDSEGQLSSMPPGKLADVIVSSPPYIELPLNDNQRKAHLKEMKLSGIEYEKGKGYGQTPGNLGNLKPGDVAAIVSSPPYEGSMTKEEKKNYAGGTGVTTQYQRFYGHSTGQLGNSQGTTFWEAARDIVAQCFAILRPGGYAIWVVKDFVRNKKRVDFTGDWRRLCESVGFKTLHEHHALLVKEERHNTLFGGQHVKRTERKSFFRRLAESKGSPRIDYEVVLCQQKDGSYEAKDPEVENVLTEIQACWTEIQAKTKKLEAENERLRGDPAGILSRQIAEVEKLVAENKQPKAEINRLAPKHKHDHEYFHADCYFCKIEQDEWKSLQKRINNITAQVAQYKKKPYVITAAQFLPGFYESPDIPAEFKEACCRKDDADATFVRPHIHTLEGLHWITVNDWIIKGVKGEFYPCKPDIFALTYELEGE